MSSGTPSPDQSAKEAQSVRGRYARRDAASDAQRYSLNNPYALAAWKERQSKMIAMLAQAGATDFSTLDVLDVGCGAGRNLQDLLSLGAKPERVQGIELLQERADAAKATLPSACRIWNADALSANMAQAIASQSQDLVVLFTVFSSILSPTVQQQLAAKVWDWLKPGGSVLWHDFIYNNPRNPDVRGVPVKQLHALFPQAKITVQSVTLAPPIGRVACKLSPSFYPLLGSIPLLRTHVLCLISKPLS